MTNSARPARAGLRVGFVPGVTLTKWRTTWKERFPRVPLEVLEVSATDQRGALDAGDADLCFLRLPVNNAGLHLIRLYEEVPVAWIAKDHAFAALESVSVAELAEQEVLEEVDPHSIDLVVMAGAVLLVPMSIARMHSRRDLVYRPVTDAPTSTVALAWRVDVSHELIDEFVGIVRGRTVNSSRTAQERAAAQVAGKARRPALPTRTQSGRRPRRRGR